MILFYIYYSFHYFKKSVELDKGGFIMEVNQLLKLLDRDSRMNVVDLAAALNESEAEVSKTIETLEKNHVICGYHTLINWDKTNTERVTAFIEVKVTPERIYGYDRIAKSIYNYPEVDTMYLLSGSTEFVVIIHGKTMQEVAQFVGSRLACIPSVTGTSTAFVLKQYKVDGYFMEDDSKDTERLLVTP